MSYDEDFYNAYLGYLTERTVRDAHGWALSIIKLNPAFDNVVDLGCGLHHEFRVCNMPSYYVGIDINAEPEGVYASPFQIFAGDYRTMNLDEVLTVTGLVRPTAMVSLFSSEITATHEENNAFYDKLFEYEGISALAVSGFYYESKKHQNPIVEACGLTSFQTLEPLEAYKSEWFTERRLIVPAPSKLFGPDVIEVWKILERRG